MNTLVWIVVVVIFVLLLLLAVISCLRAASPHSRKMAHEQEQLNRKTGMSNAATATAPPASKSMVGKGFGWFKSNLVTALFVVVLMLFVVVPAGFWVRDAFLPQVICKDVSAHETRNCVLNTAWSTWVKAAEGPTVDGMQVCATPGGQSERVVMNGTAFFRFKADEGRLVKAYRLFPPNEACPATLS